MNAVLDFTFSIPGYNLVEQLYCGSRTIVYRGIRELDGQPVVIKLLKREYPTFNELLQFRNQYSIANNLEIPGIVRFLCLEPYRNSYALVMEDFGGVSLKLYAQDQLLSITEILEIALQLADILHGLYCHRVIHKDIKPANILIHPHTKQVKVIDFSIASLLPKETTEIKSINGLEGTLSYLSPEQTGRMNRGIDYRSDFYSLGVTLYELLTGELPFESNEPMELVHCHIAKLPNQLGEKREEIPEVLSDIVMKLMAKNPEDRYQSALGLKFDLENCLVQLQQTGKIDHFIIGQRDLCDRFIIPEKLYGRENEVEQLLAAFERVTNPPISPLSKGGDRGVELMLVAGFSGIGKTAVVNEVHKPIVRKQGYFIKGKFDQFNRSIPLSAFVQAFRNLVEQILTQSDAQIAQWKDKILGELGENAQVIIEVIPALEIIIGKQAGIPELSGTAAQNRFNLILTKFIQIFASQEHPLVIFLDDLQWADATSLKFLQLLMNQTSLGYLLLIGAYRDNEVSLAHPLILVLDEVRKAGAKINAITLQPLSHLKLNHLVADTLACLEEVAFPLSQLVYQKTKGNPFFSTQFLKALHQEGLIEFSLESGCWQCDIAQINQQALTEDVVEFMTWQLQKLPESTQFVLQLAACIGNKFDLKTLAIICQLSEVETAAALWKPLQEGLILPQSEVYKFYQESESRIEDSQEQRNSPDFSLLSSDSCCYKFLHDRVQQAAYSLIPDDQKQATHLKIGQLLLQNTKAAEQEQNLFEIVNQLNIGKSLILERSQQIQLAKLNLKAGQKARIATAYTAALEYSTTGICLLNLGEEDSCWQTQYDLTLPLYELATETAYLSGNFQQMEQFADIVLQQAKTAIDKMKVYAVKIQAEMAQAKKLQAVKIGLEALELVGASIPESPDSSDTQQAITETTNNLNGKNIEDLINLPLMTDIEKLAAARILNSIGTATYQAAPEIFPLVICKLVNLSINYGNSLFSSYGYACYSILLNEKFQDIDLAYQSSKLALKLAENFNIPDMKASAFMVAGCSTIFGKAHLRETLPILWESYQSAVESGNLEFVGYAALTKYQNSYLVGNELSVLQEEIATISDVLTQLKQENILYILGIYQQSVLNLLNPSGEPSSFRGEICDEKTCLQLLNHASDRTALFQFYFNKMILCYVFCEYQNACQNALLAQAYLDAIQGTIFVLVFNFYDSLAHLAIYSSVPSEQESILNRVANNQQKIQLWASHAPMNFLHKFYLVEAERERVQGNKAKAIEFYDRAIKEAHENDYIQEEAIANELAAKFYLDWGKERIAQDYLIAAYYGYAHWGAKAKVADLEQHYPQLLTTILQQSARGYTPNETVYANESRFISQTSSSGNSGSVSTALDLSAILKASQKLSSEIQLDKLLSALLEIVTATAGADKCVLMLLNQNQLSIEGVAQVGQPAVVLQSILLSESKDVPVSLVNTVKRSLKTTAIVNTMEHPLLLTEAYILRQQPKSLLCTPILHQGKLLGVLYLENNLTTGAFTHERVELLNLLCTQAAISLENAKLYQQAQQAIQDLQQAQLQIVQSEKMSALGNLVAGVAHEMNNPLGFIAASLKQAKPTLADIVEHLKLYQENLPNPADKIIDHAEEIDLDYSLADLPKMIDSMTIACDRLKNISTSLRTFSRADRDYKVRFNIHEGLDSTILILKHRLKGNEQRPAIEVTINYGNLPQVECFPGQLNQVFMNILANAIDALEEANHGRSFEEIKANPNQITITTSVVDKNVKIAIADNGQGMSESVKEKIFDHLFTTKGVGKGTGLGLAIAHQIVVEKHGGTLDVNSTPGEGTEFTIFIPIHEQTKS
ncbi:MULTISPECIES: ATP-binding sensor histidine kinase [Nostoc]|uniref:histidine kinase n=1 Tax=Nostoc paludosum FACHB-159 TaxID=2692908 RepID=A0ABR8KGQ4_9NOSO|nr:MULTISPECIES: ATP-binding sensor histidine kinase [Nostoc]MBD2679426.1 AAA family ATPase [Nostoc sp. FACHB-857]MBD2738725.1 AAA family ATPase [Nostoc paludosum FACHB-159]